MADVIQTKPCKAVYVNVTYVIHSGKIITRLVHCFTTGVVYEDPTLSNLNKRLHLYSKKKSKKSECTRFNAFETNIQVSLSSNSPGSEKVVHSLLIQKRCVHEWYVRYRVQMTTSPGNAYLGCCLGCRLESTEELDLLWFLWSYLGHKWWYFKLCISRMNLGEKVIDIQWDYSFMAEIV